METEEGIDKGDHPKLKTVYPMNVSPLVSKRHENSH